MKFISSGQKGAARAALDVAIKLRLPHGGWIQEGRRTDDGVLPYKYNVKERVSAAYPNYTEHNIIDSDGTIVFTHGKLIRGAKLSQKLAKKREKLFHIDFNETLYFDAVTIVHSFIHKKIIEVLNVSGSHASKDPKIYDKTWHALMGAIMLNMVDAKPGDRVTDYSMGEYAEKISPQPKTVDEAVNQIISLMPLEDRDSLANLNKEDLGILNFTMGIFIREELLQKDVNLDLFESCMAVSGDDSIDESFAASVIIEKLWE